MCNRLWFCRKALASGGWLDERQPAVAPNIGYRPRSGPPVRWNGCPLKNPVQDCRLRPVSIRSGTDLHAKSPSGRDSMGVSVSKPEGALRAVGLYGVVESQSPSLDVSPLATDASALYSISISRPSSATIRFCAPSTFCRSSMVDSNRVTLAARIVVSDT